VEKKRLKMRFPEPSRLPNFGLETREPDFLGNEQKHGFHGDSTASTRFHRDSNLAHEIPIPAVPMKTDSCHIT
jgi:hypothetical protein